MVGWTVREDAQPPPPNSHHFLIIIAGKQNMSHGFSDRRGLRRGGWMKAGALQTVIPSQISSSPLSALPP